MALSQTRFTPKEDEQIIDLVRSNECLHNVSHKQYKNNDLKHRMWNDLGKKLGRDGELKLNIINIYNIVLDNVLRSLEICLAMVFYQYR